MLALRLVIAMGGARYEGKKKVQVRNSSNIHRYLPLTDLPVTYVIRVPRDVSSSSMRNPRSVWRVGLNVCVRRRKNLRRGYALPSKRGSGGLCSHQFHQ